MEGLWMLCLPGKDFLTEKNFTTLLHKIKIFRRLSLRLKGLFFEVFFLFVYLVMSSLSIKI